MVKSCIQLLMIECIDLTQKSIIFTHLISIMKKLLISVSVLVLTVPAWAAPAVPEIDAALSLQGLALVVGVAALLKRKR